MKSIEKSSLFTCLISLSDALSTEVNETENDASIPIQPNENTIYKTDDEMETKAVPSISSANPTTSGKFPLVVHLKGEEIYP
jgi:hypothetical protein